MNKPKKYGIIWKKYGVYEAGKKKYVVGQRVIFQMVDKKSIVEQVNEYENLIVDVLKKDMKKCVIF